ncbi:MAG: DUF561 domain-containing protein [Erysipelotrichaceae bacterium]
MLINELLKIKYPIFQGAMANIATAKFAACVSNCGALGTIATGAMNADMARTAIKECKTLTNKPFAVNVMLMNPNSADIIKVICEEKVAVVTTGAGNPGIYINDLKAAGCLVIPVVPNVALARRLTNSGADALIVEGTEAGGHVGELTTMALVPQVIKAVDIPVIVAGGIACGEQVAAAFALGAAGIQVGTCLLLANECEIHTNYKQAIIKSKDSDTVVTGRSVSAPVRILKNSMSNAYMKLENSGAPREELEKLTLGGLRKAVFDGDVKNGSLMMGQVGGLCKLERPMQEILDELIEQGASIMAEQANIIDQLKYENN